MLKSWVVDEEGCAAVAQDPGVTAHLRQLAEMAVAYAQGLAPVVTGRYRDSLHVIEGTDDQGRHLVGFGSNSFAWHFVEYGSAHNQPHRVLANAAMAVADRVDLL